MWKGTASTFLILDLGLVPAANFDNVYVNGAKPESSRTLRATEEQVRRGGGRLMVAVKRRESLKSEEWQVLPVIICWFDG